MEGVKIKHSKQEQYLGKLIHEKGWKISLLRWEKGNFSV